jgi:hypothetical protein
MGGCVCRVCPVLVWHYIDIFVFVLNITSTLTPKTESTTKSVNFGVPFWAHF